MSLINVYPPKTYFGAGDIQKSLGSLPGFPWAKYPGEKHLPGHNYTGPGTRLDLRLDENDNPKPGEEPVNKVDATALKHDILYRNKDITFRHHADKQMIDELENIPNPTFKEKLQRALIIKLLKAKLKLDKDHVENRINDVKRYLRRNIKNLVDELKLQQELTSLKRLIQVDKTSQLQNSISKLDDKITNVKIDVQRLIDNPNVNEDRLKCNLTALERKLGELLAELDKTADKTELQNSISSLNEKIAKQKSDVQDIINTLPIDKDTLKRQLTALDTKITDELEKEVNVIKNFLQNKFRDDMKNYIKEQVNLLVSRIHDDFLRQERKLTKLEAIVTDKSYYFNLPFENKENKEVLKFAGYYTLKSSFVPGLSTRAKNISKISMNPSKISSVKSKDSGKPKFVELQQYPGYDKNEITPLPCDIDPIDMLSIVAQASMDLHKKPRYRPEFERLFYSRMSQAILQDIFWYFFLEKYQPGCTAQPKLFNRISHNYVKLLIYCKIKVYKETFFKDYPILMAQAIYVSFCHAFQDSYRQFGEDFKDELVNLVSEWMAGIRLAPRSWATWNFDKLDPPNIKSRDEMLPQNNKKSAPALNLDYLDSLISRHTSDGGSVTSLSQSGSKSSLSWINKHNRNQRSTNRGSHISHRQESPSPNGDTSKVIDSVAKAQISARKSLNHQKSINELRKNNETLTPIREIEGDENAEKNVMSRLSSDLLKELNSRHVIESHPACKGPDFIKTSFNIFGQSPLVTHFLRMKQLSTKSGYNVRVQRTELENLPSLDQPTYRDVIHESFKNIKDIERKFKEMYNKNLKESATYVHQQQRIVRQHEKREAVLMTKPKEVKRLSNLIILEQKKDEDSISAGADAAIETALLAE
ncbi:hypothetical protein LOTGIDRAFT_235104 [Lottia gigantea]|uniref:Phospholipase A2-like domain-containing protein n=1 Tax=Lottia gigantea TaxID=225164 RepID=V4BF23_LOTGI|nr:hypothetical protein LOTGIDRAFT_235104 [Lottia gigantea]ESO87444.1 hypothetical protein LOTGIDRAFT_235104 [Lottia gigantea]